MSNVVPENGRFSACRARAEFWVKSILWEKYTDKTAGAIFMKFSVCIAKNIHYDFSLRFYQKKLPCIFLCAEKYKIGFSVPKNLHGNLHGAEKCATENPTTPKIDR